MLGSYRNKIGGIVSFTLIATGSVTSLSAIGESFHMTVLDSIYWDFPAIPNRPANGATDLWGYSPDGVHYYAIVGLFTQGVAIIDVTDPNNIQLLYTLPIDDSVFDPSQRPTAYDVTVYNDYA